MSEELIALGEKLKAEEFKKNKRKQNFSKPDWFDLLKEIEEEVSIYYDKNKIWWVWNYKQSKWEISDETDILVLLLNYYPSTDLTNSKTKNEIINAMKLIGRSREIINPPPSWIQFKNKIIDCKNNKQIQINKKYFFTNPINWNFGISDQTPIMDDLIISWVGEKYKTLMYEIIAYCLYRDYPIHRIFCFVGSGRNGKSQFLKLITKFIGNENSTSSDLDLLMTRPFESFKLYKKLVCQMGETNYEGLKRTAILKNLSGQDLISFEKKGKDGFTEYNYAKLLISTNGIPITHDKSDGFYRRWLIIDFPNNYEGKTKKTEIYQTIPDIEYENLCFKSIKILKNLLENGRFNNEPTINEKKKIYEEKSNPLMLYIKKFMINDPFSWIGKTEMFTKFSAWLNSNGYRSISYSDFSVLMKNDYDEGQKGSEKTRSWIGLRYPKENEEKFYRREGNASNANNASNQSILHMRESNKNSVTSVTCVTSSTQISILTSIKIMFDFVDEIKESDLLKKLRNNINFDFEDFNEVIEKMKHDGEIFENPKGTFRRL